MPDAPLPTTTPSFVPEVFLSLPDSLAVSSSLDEISITPVTTTDDWAALSAAWDDLPVDRYMNDGGTYRRRRFSRFHHSRENGAGRGRLRLKAHAPYAQPLHLNPLNGGMLRHFEPILPQTIANPAFVALLDGFATVLGLVDGVTSWDINVYLNRTETDPAQTGLPVPEGLHRDGVRYSLIMGIARQNVTGAVNSVHDDDRRPLLSRVLERPGDFVLLLDERTYHDATPVLPADGTGRGTRDVIVVEFYHADTAADQLYVP
ncbi:2OG-Fe dioxygenase family protein [Tistrella mobilis]|jgi:hypothetical protein|uniref:2OG-Fe dioxygenase family protein n=1 Tax=Tistrella mobilis TaxID=171437 RepID=UPI0031F6CE15